MTEGITLNLPASVPAPRFKPFDRVSMGQLQGIIVGFEYRSFVIAVGMGGGCYGWVYSVDFTWGKSKAEILSQLKRDVLITVPESELFAVEGSNNDG